MFLRDLYPAHHYILGDFCRLGINVTNCDTNSIQLNENYFVVNDLNREYHQKFKNFMVFSK